MLKCQDSVLNYNQVQFFTLFLASKVPECVRIFLTEAATGGVLLRNFAKFAEKHLYQSLFFDKVAGVRPAKFLRTLFLKNKYGRLLLF